MKKYPTYKPSGVEWLGEVPLAWEVWKVSRLYKRIGSGTTPKAGNPEYYDNGTIPWVNTGDLNDGYISDCSNYITQKAFDDHSTLKINEAGTLLVAMYGATIGKIAITEFAACTNQACCSLAQSKLIDTKFAFYWFIANKENVVNLSYGGGQPNISQDIIRSLKIPICKLEEQKSIVRFLDYKTAQIDSFISNRQKQIELLKEQKAGIINKAVTKGIYPNAKMKTSGIEWIGDIPEHWLVIRLKYIIKTMASGVSVNSDDEPAEPHEFGILKTSCVYTGEFNPYENKRILENEYNRMTCPVKKNTIIISRMNTPELVGANGFVDKDYERLFLPDRLWQTVFFSKAKIVPKWLSYFLASNRFRTLLSSLATGTSASMKNITQNDVLGSFICLPPVEEQNEIVDFFIKEILIMDNLISKYQKQIELMQEYRTSLISQAVTGKIDVRDWKPKK